MEKKIKKKKIRQNNDMLRLGMAIMFMGVVFIYASVHAGGIPNASFESMALLVVAALFGAYMAMNIGANDVANNMGPAVGAKALSLGAAIGVAAVFELLGAVVAGGEVVSTIKSGIIDPSLIGSSEQFVWLMMSALLAGALWLNLATVLRAPVSTTHSIVGAVLGAGVVAGGASVVNWSKMGVIVSSWVVSPLLGGLIAAFLLYAIKRTITYQTQMTRSASKVVPLLAAFMAWAFATYMLIKGLGNVVSFGFAEASLVGLAIGVAVYFGVRPMVKKRAEASDNTKESVNALFTLPLIFSAALLSFAHGANDVANAIGPLAAINEVLTSSELSVQATIPLWIMLLGALGLVVGLALFGPRLIQTVGNEITDLDQMRAYCIAMASALTVILASQLGLPISTTHVAIGAVFGVGFLREYLKQNYAKMENLIIEAHDGEEKSRVESYLSRFNSASLTKKALMLKAMKKRVEKKQEDPKFSKKDRKVFKKAYKKELVKRSMVIKIAAAWVITVPATALIAAVVYMVVETILGG